MKIGLVLSGGGARGAYQIGVWKALRELKLDRYIEVVSGTSIGALNAILFCQGDIEKAENAWLNISKEKVLPTDNKDLNIKGFLISLGLKNMNLVKKCMPKMIDTGSLSREGLTDIMNKYVNFKDIENCNKLCYAACTELTTFQPKYFKINGYHEENIRSILFASSALPMIYESEEFESIKYVDGGMADNVPVQPVYGENCDIIIVVHLSKDSHINKKLFPNTKIIEIYPSVMEEGVLDGILDFVPESAEKRIKLGYIDTIDYLKPIMDLGVLVFKHKPIPDIDTQKVLNYVKDKFVKKI
ncbi:MULTISPECIES: patatin-like phospholipase family protein [Clostridium]|uniref:patatin-like phospholipase family protein n=1 Tax=Clostridium TaxID=1485 RepID=UPI0013F0C464|nr:MULTISPECIES: patatin-like phospholipase family protein [Clostridium]MBY7026932.1 patatin-like phospholipase family protein [Clostridium botulinum]NFH92053.1 patatin-like phospholipase family protein [Clostridium botulinum]NFI19577.1 patatin-like phospholipase family protein [Clostridium botulinum]NFI54731.1 patatin-like phospholipase family protein [Clostridium botulinum]NFL94528.1 patatin-like phospholipase family protein [Clostridium botulinum]